MGIVVLGGSGFFGQHVMEELRRRGHAPHSLSRRSGCDIRDLPEFTRRLGDLSPRVVVNSSAHVGSVHYALEHAATMIDDNTQLIVNVFRALAEACPEAVLINPLSNCSYPGEIDVQDEPRWQAGPVHYSVLAFASTRRLIQAFAESYHRQHGTRSINWLVANAFGPGDYLDPNRVHAFNGIVIRMIKARRAGQREFEIWGSGTPIREWVFVKDAARVLADSAEAALRDPDHVRIEPLNLAQKRGYTISEVATEIARVMEYPVQLVFNTKYPDGAPVKVLDDARFRSAFPGFRFTPFEDAVRETVAYFEQALK